MDIFLVDPLCRIGYFVPDMRKKEQELPPLKKNSWAKVNIKSSRMDVLLPISIKARLSIPQCVDEALELWIREIAPKRIGLSNFILKESSLKGKPKNAD